MGFERMLKSWDVMCVIEMLRQRLPESGWNVTECYWNVRVNYITKLANVAVSIIPNKNLIQKVISMVLYYSQQRLYIKKRITKYNLTINMYNLLTSPITTNFKTSTHANYKE